MSTLLDVREEKDQADTCLTKLPANDPAVIFRVVNRVAIITLNRPSALNALSHDMVRELTTLIERCRTDGEIIAVVMRGAGTKGFCAGGDVRALYLAATTGDTAWRQFFVDEYRLDFALHTLQKPLVALMDGVTMGGAWDWHRAHFCASSQRERGSRCLKRALGSSRTSAQPTFLGGWRSNWNCTLG